jgi:MFS family permease
MRQSGTGERARQAGRTVYAASQRAGRISAAAAGGAGRLVHRMSSASGAGRTGLSNLIELTAAGSVGDAFVAVSLAGSLFFSTSVAEARGRAAFALLITIAPYAILAPLIGPLLDRVRQGNKYILMGTLLARGLLCWGMSGAIHNSATLLPAAFGVLVLQKAYSVTKSAVTPRLLPSEITLVTANARANLGSLIATSLGAAVALGIDKIFGGGSGGAAWVLRVATLVYLAAMIIGWRLPPTVDVSEQAAEPAEMNGRAQQPGATLPLSSAPRRRSPIPHVGPVVAEAMRANAAIRVFYGFMLFFLAFILRSERFGHVSHTVALGGLAVAVAVGGMLGTGIGSALRSRAPLAMIFTVLGLVTIISAACAIVFGLWSVLLVALVAAIGQTLVKVALDSVLQREIPEETRSSTFAFSETVHQLALVGGGLIGLALSLTGSGLTGLTFAAAGLLLAMCGLVISRRRRVVSARHEPPGPPSPQSPARVTTWPGTAPPD